MKTKTINLYEFDECSDELKAKILDNLRDINVDHDDWHEHIIDRFTEETKEFDVIRVYYSGFWSQGDGAMFEYDKVNLFDQFVAQLELSPMRKSWLKTQGYVTGYGKHRGYYYHSGCCEHYLSLESNFTWTEAERFANWISSFEEQFQDYVKEIYENLCSELYRDLKKEYDYYTSDEAIIETIQANEYTFNEDGKIES